MKFDFCIFLFVILFEFKLIFRDYFEIYKFNMKILILGFINILEVLLKKKKNFKLNKLIFFLYMIYGFF